jgi:hypothetical protein
VTADDRAARWILGRLMQVRATRRYARLAKVVEHEVADAERREALGAILLVEMTARSTVHRAAEWMLAWLTKGRLAKTRGPLQLSDAPFEFDRAVRQAVELLNGADLSPNGLAHMWNGSTMREPGSRVAYSTAVAQALDLLARPRSLLSADHQASVILEPGHETSVARLGDTATACSGGGDQLRSAQIASCRQKLGRREKRSSNVRQAADGR